MTDIEYGLTGLKIVVLILGIGLAYRYVLYPAMLENWRQDLFAIRNTLWDRVCHTGEVANPEHQAFRNRINAVIRHASGMDFFVFLFAVRSFTSNTEMAPKVPPLERTLSSAARHDLELAEILLIQAIIRRVLFQTFPGVVIGYPAFVTIKIIRLFRSVSQKVRHEVNQAKAGVPRGIQSWARAKAYNFAKDFESAAVYSDEENKMAVGVSKSCATTAVTA